MEKRSNLFYLHAPTGRDIELDGDSKGLDNFYSHALAGRDHTEGGMTRANFYSHTPCGVRPEPGFDYSGYLKFLHTPRAGGDSLLSSANAPRPCFYSHAPLGARHFPRRSAFQQQHISTHTPLARRDFNRIQCSISKNRISTHTLLAR